MEASFIFELGRGLFGFPASAIQQTLLGVTPQPVPWMPPFHLGLFQNRGEILPLLDIRRFLNEPDAHPLKGETVLVVGGSGFRFGLMTGKPRFIPAPAEPYPLHVSASIFPALDGTGVLDGRQFTIINPPRLQAQLVSAVRETMAAA